MTLRLKDEEFDLLLGKQIIEVKPSVYPWTSRLIYGQLANTFKRLSSSLADNVAFDGF